MRAVQLYIKYDMSIATVRRELGYPSRGMLYNWYREFIEKGTLRSDNAGYSKYTKEQRKQAVAYYLEHGRSISRTIKALGFPKSTALRDWVQEDLPKDKKPCLTSRKPVRYTPKQREQAVIRLCAGDGTTREIASDFGASESTLRAWKKHLLDERCNTTMLSKRPPDNVDLVALAQQAEELRKEVYCLQLERDILQKAGEILKKDMGINLAILTNREKAVLIDALKKTYRLKELLKSLNMAKSSYFYQKCALNRPDKYIELRSRVKDIFTEAYSSYGYRRIHASIQREGTCVSEKVVRKIMEQEHLIVTSIRKKRYSSYVGEISPEVENIIDRDFSASVPNSKWLTDITEFSLSAGKVYLSPVIDCFDGMAVSWAIGTSPNAELANSMLEASLLLLGKGERPIIHSDRGGHYRWPGWIELVNKAKLTRSMSKKGCLPDNSACEGFFGRVKNEMFYGRSWTGVSTCEFMRSLDIYMRWYNEKRIKMSLGAKSPLEYRRSIGLTV